MKTIVRRRGQAFYSMATAVTLILGGSIVSAQPAAAVAPTCNFRFVTSELMSGSPLDAPGFKSGSTATTSCNLSKGNSNVAVSSLQRALNFCYGSRLVVDSVFGNATVSALKSAQKKEGVGADGVYGPQTAAKLKFADPNVNQCTGRQRTF